LEIADSGGGIPDDEIKQVIKKFYRGRHAGHGGTGLAARGGNASIEEGPTDGRGGDLSESIAG
jgi:K+-sensing histidine kinase KdpD